MEDPIPLHLPLCKGEGSEAGALPHGLRRAAALKGLPASYRVTAGDMLAFDYGSGPSRALHRIREGVGALSGCQAPDAEGAG